MDPDYLSSPPFSHTIHQAAVRRTLQSILYTAWWLVKHNPLTWQIPDPTKMRLLEHPVSSLHAACPHPVLGHAAAKRRHGSTCISGVSAIGDNYFLIAALNSPVSFAHNTLRDRTTGRLRERRRLRRMLCTYVCVCACVCVFVLCSVSVCLCACVSESVSVSTSVFVQVVGGYALASPVRSYDTDKSGAMTAKGSAYLSFPSGASPLRKQRFFGDSGSPNVSMFLFASVSSLLGCVSLHWNSVSSNFDTLTNDGRWSQDHCHRRSSQKSCFRPIINWAIELVTAQSVRRAPPTVCLKSVARWEPPLLVQSRVV
jgi:hypothetical protein